MTHGGSRIAALLFIGDLAVFVVSLWLTLFVRYQRIPSEAVFMEHLLPFSILFALWVFVFYISGLYGKGIILLKTRWPDAIMRTQVANVILAALFFFLAPGIAIAPKTNLVIYLVVSLLLIFVWRLAVYPRLTTHTARYPAVLLADGEEAERLAKEVNDNPRYRLYFAAVISPKTEWQKVLLTHQASLVVADTDVPGLEAGLIRLRPQTDIVPFSEVYEEVFDQVLITTPHQERLVSSFAKPTMHYLIGKRCIDIVGGIGMGVVTLLITPFIFIAQRLEGEGPLFISQHRIGVHGKQIRVFKFRTMERNDPGAWAGEGKENKVTKTGNVLRRTSLDEFPQFINVLLGELSLIGPRSDIEALGKRLSDAIPYYQFRYVVTPGITGWAQINQKYEPGNISPQSIEETKVRLAYDFYYLKKRSLAIDFVIALKTIKHMFFRVSNW
jgi:lipopolysaccharide/colanic/teichoic acid biosynthesis glycosyltransferase